MQRASFLVIFCIILVNNSINGLFVNYQDNNNENNNNSTDKNIQPSLAERIIRANVQSSVIGSSGPSSTVNSFEPTTTTTTTKEKKKKTRMNKQEEEPIAITAQRVLAEHTEKIGGKYSYRSHFYRSNQDSISDMIAHQGYYMNTNYRIFGSEIIFTKVRNNIHITDDSYMVITDPVDLKIGISQDEAIYVVELLDNSPTDPNKEAVVELVVLPKCYDNKHTRHDLCNNKKNGMGGTLAYLVELPNNNIYFISAQTGENLFSYRYEPTAFAITYYNGNQTITTNHYNGTYYLEDLTRNATTLNCNYGNCTTVTNTTRWSDSDNIWNSTNEYIANQVQWGTAAVLDYFKTMRGRNGLNGTGGPLTALSVNGVNQLLPSSVHYGGDPNYSGWTGTQFIFGDGDGVNYGPMVSLDVIAHEFGHALIEFACNLNYYGEPGALGESFGDVTAAVVSYHLFNETNGTWTFAEDNYTPLIPGDALRYLNEPHLAANRNFTANDDPDYYADMYNGTLDNGGVHENCGVPNKAFYLLAKGGNHSHGGPSMTGIGIEPAYAIVYRAVTVYYTSTTNMMAARNAWLSAARDIYNSSTCFEYIEVQTAWALCGVGNFPAPITQLLSNNGFEDVLSPWGLNNWGGGAYWYRSGNHPDAGRGNILMGVNNDCTGEVWQNITGLGSTCVVANFTFDLWVVTTEVNNTRPYDNLWIEVHNSATGVIIGQIGVFTNEDDTVWYENKVLDMSPYIGESNLQIVFKVQNSDDYPSKFYIDEAYLYTICY